VIRVEQWAEIRRMHFIKGLSIKEIHRRTGLHRQTIRRALRSSEPPRYRRRRLPALTESSPRSRRDAQKHVERRAGTEFSGLAIRLKDPHPRRP
jgi:transposase